MRFQLDAAITRVGEGTAGGGGEAEAPAKRRDETSSAETKAVHARDGAEAEASPPPLAVPSPTRA